jgi:hypothetical protein
MAALAGLTKFVPLALAPMLATYRGDRDPGGLARRAGMFTAGFAGAAALALLPVLLGDDSLRTAWDRTVGFQVGRGSPFSVWGLYGGLHLAQKLVQAAAVILALVVAFAPRRRDLGQVAALGAAVIVAVELGITHWFYLYLVWFLPFALVALFARYREPEPA